MVRRKEIEETRPTADGIAKMAQLLGYEERWAQLLFNNGASATNLIEFFDDNPGACDAVIEWVLKHGLTRDGQPLDDDDDEDEET